MENGEMPRTHDYSSSVWGHSTSGWNTKDGGLTATCCGWGQGINQGDYIILKNGEGSSRYQFEEVDYFRDPSDMWKAKLKFAPRQS